MNAYTESTYGNASIIYAVSLALSAISFLIFIFGMFSKKIVTLELVAIFQVTYLSLVALDHLPPTIYALRGLSLSCGFSLDLLHSGPVINKYSAINLQASFVDNYNLNILLVLLPIAASLIINIIFITKKK